METATEKPQRLPVGVNKPTPYTFDLGNLLASDPNPLVSTTEEALTANARDGAQALLNQLLTTCPINSTPSGVLMSLPAPSTTLPREKPLPPEKKKTKWEQFAARKGIKPKKREGKMVMDEASGEWVPKYGYKGINKKNDNQWLVEVDDKGDKQGEAPRNASRGERKDRIRRNERRMRANEKRGRKAG